MKLFIIIHFYVIVIHYLEKGGICDPLVYSARNLPVHILHPTLCHDWSGCTTTTSPATPGSGGVVPKKDQGEIKYTHTHTQPNNISPILDVTSQPSTSPILVF